MRDASLIDINEYPQYDPNCHAWKEFESYADDNGIGDHIDDWFPSWTIWCGGYNSAMNDLR